MPAAMDAPAARVDLVRRSGAEAVLTLAGVLDVSSTAAARREVEARLAAARVTALAVDGSGIERGDMSGMSLLYELAEGRLVPGVRATIAAAPREILLKTYMRRIPLSQRSAAAVVAAWNRGLGEVMGEFLPDLKAALLPCS